MKRLQKCYLLYAADNNDYLPWNRPSGQTWVSGNAQTDYTLTNIQNSKLFIYDKSTYLYVCPANTRKITISQLGLPRVVPQTRTCSIEYSMGGFTTTPGDNLSRGGLTFGSYARGDKVGNPARKLVFADENEYSVDDCIFALFPSGSNINVWWNMAGSRHDRGCTFSFFDCRVEYYRWHGSAVLEYPAAGTEGLDWPADPPSTSDDLPRVEAGGSTLFPVN